MKVVKKGRKQRGWSQEFKCTGGGNGGGGCGATLLVSEYDLYYTHSQARDETTDCKTFCCVSCGVETDIDLSVRVEPKGKRPNEAERTAIALREKASPQRRV